MKFPRNPKKPAPSSESYDMPDEGESMNMEKGERLMRTEREYRPEMKSKSYNPSKGTDIPSGRTNYKGKKWC